MTLKQIKEMYETGKMTERAALRFISLLGYVSPHIALYKGV